MMTVRKILRTHRISFSGMTRAFSRNIPRMYVSAAVGTKIIGGICRLFFFFFLGDAPVSRKEIYEIKSPMLFRFARERVENVTRVQAAKILSA